MTSIDLEKVKLWQPNAQNVEKAARFGLYVMREAFSEVYVGNKGINPLSGKVTQEQVNSVTSATDEDNVSRLREKMLASTEPDSGTEYWLASDGRNEIYGFTKVVNLGRKTIELEEIDVLPRYWSNGIGSRLMYGVVGSRIISDSASQVTLKVVETNQRARAWYEQLGFSYTGEKEKVSLFPGSPKQRRLVMSSGIHDVAYNSWRNVTSRMNKRAE